MHTHTYLIINSNTFFNSSALEKYMNNTLKHTHTCVCVCVMHTYTHLIINSDIFFNSSAFEYMIIHSNTFFKSIRIQKSTHHAETYICHARTHTPDDELRYFFQQLRIRIQKSIHNTLKRASRIQNSAA